MRFTYLLLTGALTGGSSWGQGAVEYGEIMGMYDVIQFEGDCPFCGARGDLSVQHKWGHLSMKTQHVGDRILWEDPSVAWKIVRGSPRAHILVSGLVARCAKCASQASPASSATFALIEIANDVILGVSYKNELEEARRLFAEIESGKYLIWSQRGDVKEMTKTRSYATLAVDLAPHLLGEYVRLLLEKSYGGRSDILAALEIIARDMSDIYKSLDPSVNPPAQAISLFGLDKVRKALESVAKDTSDPLALKAGEVLQLLPEKITL